MKIIDLLNKIANGKKVPKEIKIEEQTWVYDNDTDYKGKYDNYLFDTYLQINERDLNKEVEIIEEDKKIEKIDYYDHIGVDLSQAVCNKINEIIDYINKE